MPGLRRERRGDAFVYIDPQGHELTDEARLQQIRKLAIPPAYTEVWICPKPNGHLQATGRDARGRKQYRYHPDFRAHREDHKFERLREFGQALPRIRERVAQDLKASTRAGPSRTLVLATLVRLLDTTVMRVGNDEYARGNRSYGLTTLRRRHAGLSGSKLKLRFRGKHGVMHEVALDDPQVARVVRRCQQLPGQELFHYVGEDGETHAVGSSEVNDYLEEAAGERFTAKDFRTWHGSVHALELLRLACRESEGAPKLAPVIAEVAQRLGNTAAVCRKAYVHPAVLALSEDEEAATTLCRRLGSSVRPHGGLSADEWRLLRFLEQPHGGHQRTSARSSSERAVKAHALPKPGVAVENA
ncbi:DNA topoisomerase IB [Azohydromonas sp. G-1-1-14]|uniref:DNA topoisomerase n=2 Tax=Azohydromonas caseinilytica TaxID=2728836 RepID=A0A848F588_9BURK|nr:DNA topoisomerase IB [Azohydromonas caseinilytica]